MPARSLGQVLAASPSTAAGGASAQGLLYAPRAMALLLSLAGAFLRELSPQVHGLSTLVFVVSGGLLLLAFLPE
ncbi:MAG: hypothetical protein ACODUE_05305 [Synechococcus sp.]